MKTYEVPCIWVIESKPAGAGSSWNICWGEGATMVWPTRARARAYAKEQEDYSEDGEKFRAVCYRSADPYSIRKKYKAVLAAIRRNTGAAGSVSRATA